MNSTWNIIILITLLKNKIKIYLKYQLVYNNQLEPGS